MRGFDSILNKMNRVLALLASALVANVVVLAQERMPPIPPEKMTDAQKKAAQDYKDLRNQTLGGGPWGVILRVPDLMVPSVQFRIHNQKNSALSPKLTEFAILIAARHWTNNYEFIPHSAAAAKDGLSPETIAAIVDGRRPEKMSEDEQAVYDFCDELLHNQSVTDPTYARMLAKFGEPGIVEAASLEGYYTYLSMLMNVARTPVAPGAKPPLTPFPK
jgi:4-carboxymuconolactone decarboxylase